MDIVKLAPATKNYIWGGTKLKQWGKRAPYDHIAECWELSFNASGPSLIASGPFQGKELLKVATASDIGAKPASFKFFPVLIKLIDAGENLSVQVHPSDAYALANEGQYGKTEMWYVIESEPHAGLYVGFNRPTSPEEVRHAIADDSIMSLLNFVEVKPGDVLFIPSGTVHAIGKGVTVMEIQQNSTLTYRLYDYHRLGTDGHPRQLHVDKALKVLSYEPYHKPTFKSPIIGTCSYFTSSYHDAKNEPLVEANDKSFASITFIDDKKGFFNNIPYRKGDSFFIPAGKKGMILGLGKYIKTEVI